VVILTLLAVAATWPLAAEKPGPAAKAALPDNAVEAISKPSGDVRLAMVEPGLIAKVLVKEGTPVKAGDVLIQLDDAIRRAELEFAQAEAESTTRIDAAVATLEQKRVYEERLSAAGQKAASQTERELAKLDVEIATRQLELEQFVQAQNVRKVRELTLRIDRMRIVSPINGKVEQLVVKDGEAVDAMAQVVRVVNVDPLWVDVPMPMAKARALAKALKNGDGGDTVVNVCFPGADGRPDFDTTCAGTVIHVAEVADGASLLRVVRVEVPNPGDRPAGEHVWVWTKQ
jgi:RND family efflux transporter MFP subunit